MIDRIKKYVTSISKLCVLEQLTFEDKVNFNYLEIAVVKDELKILKQESFLDIESFDKLNAKKLPVVVTVNGHNLLTKVNPSNLDAFENDSFLISTTEFEGNSYCNIVRKSVIDPVLNYLTTHKYLLLDVVIGPFTLVKYQDLFQTNLSELTPHRFNKENEIINYSFDKIDQFIYDKIQLGEETIPTNMLAGVSNGVDYILNKQFNKENTAYSANREESIYAKLVPVLLSFFVGVLLLSLVSNYLYQNHLSKKYQDSELKSSEIDDKKNQLSLLKNDIKEKERVFNEFGLKSNHQYAEYLDVLASLKPNKILLNTLAINPLLKELKNGKKANLNKDKVILSGDVDDIETLNDYLIKIENHPLFNKAKIVIFKQVKTYSVFELEIEL